jgi:DNA-binding response OmpR family regulator
MTQILIVDDSPTQAARLEAILQNQAFNVTSARDAEQALRIFDLHPFDVVISDVVMPGMSGFDFCRRIKADARGNVPVILLTSLHEPMDIIRGLECGADNFLTKPYEAKHLIRRIDTVLANRRVRAGENRSAAVDLIFCGQKFTVTSEKQQILDLLISNFEDKIRANEELMRREVEVAAAKAELQNYASQLENRVAEQTAELARANAELKAEISARKEAQERLVSLSRRSVLGA